MSATDRPSQDSASIPKAAQNAARRFWERRSKGERISVDEVLDVPRSDEHYLQTRATTIRIIADEASKSAGGFDVPLADSNSERATLDSASTPMQGLGTAPPTAPAPAKPIGTPTVGPSAFGAVSSANGSRSDATPLPKIDGYDIISCLGRGGMGVVFEGYQQSTGRRVAIKFMLDAALMSEAARKRFEREVEVVARLQHQGIVSIIDSGVRKGKYFYVMEYVEGRPLDLAMPAGKCDIREAFRMIIQICDAVDYAHQRGVLHRDLKPSNIIVDNAGVPHLLDFGLAKLVEDDEGKESHGKLGLTMSQPGQLLGTIAYMSPEQAAGKNEETSVRTDVYALGAILFELITGELPIRMGGSLKEILHWIAEEEPTAPSKLRKGLDKDIDAILLKPVEKKPDNRYATAGEFAADIKRYLAHEPIIARRVGMAGKSWRWVQRNRALATVIGIAVTTLLSVSTFSFVKVVGSRNEAIKSAAEAKASAKEATEQRGIAEKNATDADRKRREAAEALSLLRNLLESTDPDQAKTMPQLVEKMSSQVDMSKFEFENNEAVIREIIAGMQRKLGDYDKAIANLSKSVPIRERTAEGDDPELASTLHELAAAYWWLGKIDQAEPLYERSFAMRQRMFKSDKAEMADSLTHMGALRLRQGRLQDAKDLYTRALAMRRRLFGQEDARVAPSLNNLAKVHQELEEFDQAEALFRQSLNMMLREKGDSDSGTAFASQNLAQCLLDKGDAEGARAAYQRAYDIRYGKVYVGKNHHLTAASLCGLAQATLALGDLPTAKSLATRGLEMYRSTRAADHPDIADAKQVLGRALVANGEVDASLEYFQSALATVKSLQPPDPLRLGRLQIDLGEALIRTGNKEQGLKTLHDGLEAVRARKGDASRITRHEAERLAQIYAKANETELAAYAAALARGTKSDPPK